MISRSLKMRAVPRQKQTFTDCVNKFPKAMPLNPITVSLISAPLRVIILAVLRLRPDWVRKRNLLPLRTLVMTIIQSCLRRCVTVWPKPLQSIFINGSAANFGAMHPMRLSLAKILLRNAMLVYAQPLVIRRSLIIRKRRRFSAC